MPGGGARRPLRFLERRTDAPAVPGGATPARARTLPRRTPRPTPQRVTVPPRACERTCPPGPEGQDDRLATRRAASTTRARLRVSGGSARSHPWRRGRDATPRNRGEFGEAPGPRSERRRGPDRGTTPLVRPRAART